MTHDDFDDGLVHGHHWAGSAWREGKVAPVVADAATVATPSSVHHDEAMYAE